MDFRVQFADIHGNLREGHKIGQGHSRVIICINYDGQESPMLHTKFRENRPAGSGEEDF